MAKDLAKLFFAFVSLCLVPLASQALEGGDCQADFRPRIDFVEFQSYDLENDPPTPLTIKGKLKLPVQFDREQRCFVPKRDLPAVVILHGSGGIDSRGDFYARALNTIGIATLEIDMWEARGVTGGGDRPPLPLFTYPDAFEALSFLSSHENVDPGRIGVLGFSWGGVVSLAAAEQLYRDQFSPGGLSFAAHVAHYPICYGYNRTDLPPLNPPAERGVQFVDLTGAPVLIQIGTEDDYDNGPENCIALANGLPDPDDRAAVEVAVYDDAYHAWDRLQVPITVLDPFADEGSVFQTGEIPAVDIIPDVDKAFAARQEVVRFFVRHL